MIMKQHTDEAVLHKCEKFYHTSKMYCFYMQKWTKKAEIMGACHSTHAYTYKQANMWKIKAEHIEAAYKLMWWLEVPCNQLNHTQVCIPFPLSSVLMNAF